MTVKDKDFRKLLGQINRDESIYAPQLFLEKNEEAQNLAALTELQLNHLFDKSVTQYLAPDRKMAAAFCMGKMSWSVLRPLAGYALNGYLLASADLKNFSIATRDIDWEVDGERGTYQGLDVHLDACDIGWKITNIENADSHRFAQLIEAIFTPLVERHFALSKLAKPALWKLVGDSFAAAFLAQGRNFDCSQKAMQFAGKVLKQRGTKLFSKQTGFFEISLPERPEKSEWFRARGGCCRYFTSEGGEYCSTCVLRDEKSRNDRLEALLRNKHLGEKVT